MIEKNYDGKEKLCEVCNQDLKKDGEYLKCSSCGIFQKLIKSEWSPKGTKWEGNHLKIYLNGSEWRRKVFYSRVNLLKNFLSIKSRGIDIGSAAGLFISEGNDFFIRGIDGIEVDDKFRNYSIDLNPKSNHYSSIYQVKKTYMFSTCFDTLGYSLNINNFLRKLEEIIEPGGFLLMSNVSIEKGLDTLTDTSFNYYFNDLFWEKTFLSYYDFKKVKTWKEVKTFNTQDNNSPTWWRDYLFLNESETVMNYSIYQKN
jgi:hypothetical protein